MTYSQAHLASNALSLPLSFPLPPTSFSLPSVHTVVFFLPLSLTPSQLLYPFMASWSMAGQSETAPAISAIPNAACLLMKSM